MNGIILGDDDSGRGKEGAASMISAQSYYDNGFGDGESEGEYEKASSVIAQSPTNNIANFYNVIIQNSSFNSSLIAAISGNGSGSEKELSTKEPIVGVDDGSVFTFMYIVSCSGYIVNSTLLFTICCRQKFRRATNYLLANLCISSLLFLMVVNLRLIERTYGPLWEYTKLNCVMWSIIRRIPQALASLTIVAISCDRSHAARILVNRPCSTDMTKKILRIWIIAILTTLPRGLLYRFTPELETSVFVYKCSPVVVGPAGIVNFLYAIIHLITIFMLPMCILIWDIYGTIQKIVFLKSRQQCPADNVDILEVQNTQLHKTQLKLLRNSCIFAALFLVCWLPWGIYQNFGDLPASTVSQEFAHLIYIHFKTVRFFPFTCTAFLPLLLVVCTCDANICGYWKMCFGPNGHTSNTTPAANHQHHPNGVLGRANRPVAPVRMPVNNVHHLHLHHVDDDV